MQLFWTWVNLTNVNKTIRKPKSVISRHIIPNNNPIFAMVLPSVVESWNNLMKLRNGPRNVKNLEVMMMKKSINFLDNSTLSPKMTQLSLLGISWSIHLSKRSLILTILENTWLINWIKLKLSRFFVSSLKK